MKDVQNYDADLEMFRETPKPADVARLRFLRWLAERGRLEHLPAGPPRGAFAEVDAARPLEAAA
jgi:hypothetical protein